MKNGGPDELEKLVLLDFVMAAQASDFFFLTHPVKNNIKGVA